MTSPWLLADIGATNARFALAWPDGMADARVLRCADFPTLVDAARHYLAAVAPATPPGAGAFAVACPVGGDIVQMTNLPWVFSIAEVRRELGLDRLDVVNDFLAVALAVPALGEDDLVKVGDGTPLVDAPVAVLGPGSGLGVALLAPNDMGLRAFATEGGHVTMAAADDREAAVLARLRNRFDHVSAERLLSGPGIVNIHAALADLSGRAADPDETPAAIVDRGLSGGDPTARGAIDMFCAMLGTVAGNLALSLGALGGVYIGGGIVPRLGQTFVHSDFRRRFVDKGIMRTYLEPVPTYVIVHPFPAFVGLHSGLAGRPAAAGVGTNSPRLQG